jgi:uncharacterized protein
MQWTFRWNANNVDHIAEHGITPDEAEFVVRMTSVPFPEEVGDGKFRVCGQSIGGAYLQVIFIYSPHNVIYVVHARPLNDREKRRFRRRQR